MNNIEYVAVGTLQPYGGNARTHSLKQARGTRATDRVPCPESRTWPIRRRKSSRSPQTIGAEAVLASRTTSVQCDRFVARCVGDRLVSRIPIARSSMPGNDGAETALRGWGGRTRTAESVGIKIRRHCRGNLCRFGRNGAAETVRVRAAALPTCSCGKDFAWCCAHVG